MPEGIEDVDVTGRDRVPEHADKTSDRSIRDPPKTNGRDASRVASKILRCKDEHASTNTKRTHNIGLHKEIGGGSTGKGLGCCVVMIPPEAISITVTLIADILGVTLLGVTVQLTPGKS